MKLNFSKIIILIYSIHHLCLAKEAILITHQNKKSTAEMLIQILTKKFNFPAVLITEVSGSSICNDEIDSVMHICIDEFDEIIIQKNDLNLMRNNFRIFTEKREE